MPDLRPLKSKRFRHLASALWANAFGNWIGEIALTLLVYDRTHSPIATAGLFLSLKVLPALLAAPLTIRLEALPARAALSSMYVLEAVCFAGIAWLARHFSLAPVLILSGLDGLLAVTAGALMRGATANHLLKDDLLRDGNGLLNLGSMVASAGSPMVAGVIIAWKGPGPALLIDAATFLVAAAVMATAPAFTAGNGGKTGVLRRLDEVWAIFRRDRSLQVLIGAIALVMFVAAIPIPVEVVFAKRSLHVGDSGYGLLLGSWSLGMVVGGGGFIAGRKVPLLRLILSGTLLSAVGYAALALSPTLALACGSSALGGIGNGAAWVAALTAVQERVPGRNQSVIMAVVQALNQVMPATGYVAGGVITAAASARVAYGTAAAGIGLVVLGGSLLMKRPPNGPSDPTDRLGLESGIEDVVPSSRTPSQAI